MLVVEQSGNGGGAKKAKAGGSGKEIAAEAVAATEKQDSTRPSDSFHPVRAFPLWCQLV